MPARSGTKMFLKRFIGNWHAVIGLGLILSLVLLCLFAPFISHYDPVEQDLSKALLAPSPQHLLGTDYLGRDLLTRILYGGRLTLTISFLSVALGLAIGLPLGAISGYFGGWADMLIQRVTDILLSFPSFLLALMLVSMLGIGVRNLIISIGIMAIPSFIRLVRAYVLSLREMAYVEASRSLGSSDWAIILKHIIPNVWAPVIVNASLNMGYAISTSTGLGFLGMGVPFPTPEWGMMMGEAQDYLFSHPFMVIYPGIVIFIAIIGFNLLGDGLRDAMDPHLRNIRNIK
jgi:ABC-type dipeptide/oligopeptide/nickel transport system permease subunit